MTNCEYSLKARIVLDTRKQESKLKKIERLIYMRNVDSTLNKKGPIEHTVEVNIFY